MRFPPTITIQRCQNLLPLLLSLFLLIGCEKADRLHEYEELIIAPQESKAMSFEEAHPFLKADPGMTGAAADDQQTSGDASLAPALHWVTPPGWVEEQGAGMRLATFHPEDQGEPDCSIVSLGGQAGGLRPNMTRWLGQLEIDISLDEIDAFINAIDQVKTEGGLIASVADFTTLASSETSNITSMMAAIIQLEDQTIFVKMMGPISAIRENQRPFKALVQSLKVH